MPLSPLPQTASQIRHITDLVGPQGPIEAILNTGTASASLAAVLCHPYPPAGGSLHNKVVYNATKAVNSLGIPSLRFNFRGVGRSAGVFDHGHGEQEDVLAAVSWVEQHLGLPVLLVGFSFGAYVGLRATCNDPRVTLKASLGFPVRPIAGRDYTFDFLIKCSGPLLFVSGDHDEFCPIPVLEAALASLPARHELSVVSGADHFFAGIPTSPESKLSAMQQVLTTWILQERESVARPA